MQDEQLFRRLARRGFLWSRSALIAALLFGVGCPGSIDHRPDGRANAEGGVDFGTVDLGSVDQQPIDTQPSEGGCPSSASLSGAYAGMFTGTLNPPYAGTFEGQIAFTLTRHESSFQLPAIYQHDSSRWSTRRHQ